MAGSRDCMIPLEAALVGLLSAWEVTQMTQSLFLHQKNNPERKKVKKVCSRPSQATHRKHSARAEIRVGGL